MKIKIGDLSTAVQKILAEYGDSVTEAVKAAVPQVAKIAKQETQAGSPVRNGRGGGRYQKDWSVKTTIGRLGAEAIVHNRGRYQLSHLLEKGHATRNGGRTQAIVHIAPAERHAIENMEKAVKRIAQEG